MTEAEVTTDNAEALDGNIYKCKSCGNFLSYDPESGKLKCEHCDSLFDLRPAAPAIELAYEEHSEERYEEWGGVKCVKCRSCGAVTTLNTYQTALTCPFCGAPNVTAIDDLPGLKPNCLLPFRISRKNVREIYGKWLKGKLFAPAKLKKKNVFKDSEGIYIPCFTFDAQANAAYTIRYGQHYTVTVGSGKNRRTETRTRWYVDRGSISDFFDDVQVEASTKVTQKDLRKLGGFDTDHCVGYHSQYITGYSAERYSKSLDESYAEATEIMKDSLRASIVSRYRADVVDYVKMDCVFSQRTYKYTLVPIWAISYRYNKKQYGCVINGRNGRVTGRYPLSPYRVSVAAVLIALALAGLIWLIWEFLL